MARKGKISRVLTGRDRRERERGDLPSFPPLVRAPFFNALITLHGSRVKVECIFAFLCGWDCDLRLYLLSLMFGMLTYSSLNNPRLHLIIDFAE